MEWRNQISDYEVNKWQLSYTHFNNNKKYILVNITKSPEFIVNIPIIVASLFELKIKIYKYYFILFHN